MTILALARAIQTADQIQQGGFAGSRRTNDRNRLAPTDPEADLAQRDHLAPTVGVNLPDPPQLDQISIMACSLTR
jgi:hypothetical protein